MPFWIRFELSPGAVIYAFALAVLAAIIMGVLPGLKATGVSLNANLHELHGRSGTRLGATWTTLIVAQVAVAVAVLPAAVFIASRVIRMEMAGPGFAAESFVVASAGLSADAVECGSDRITARQVELISRLKAEPGVIGVTFSSGIPGFAGSEQIRFEEGARLSNRTDHIPDVGVTDALVPSVTRVSVDLFDTYEAQILAGRNFTAGDVGTPHCCRQSQLCSRCICRTAMHLVFVSATSGTKPIRRPPGFRSSASCVIFPPSLLTSPEKASPPSTILPGSGNLDPVVLSVRVAGTSGGLHQSLPRDRCRSRSRVATSRCRRLADRYEGGRSALRSMAWAVALVTASVLLLSAAGIYAMMSFTVAQRTREIGIRTALGAQPRRVMSNVFGRAAWQVAAGVLRGIDPVGRARSWPSASGWRGPRRCCWRWP